MAISFPAEVLSRIAYATYEGIVNPLAPKKIDRKQMPFLSYIRRRETSYPLAGANGPIVKYKRQSTLDLQGWERKDALTFNETDIDLDLQVPWSNVHMGLSLVHDDLEAMGFNVVPNQPRGKNFAKADSESEKVRLVNYVQEIIESVMDNYDVKEDQLLLQDNSSNPKLPQGLDQFLPFGYTPGMSAGSGEAYGYYSSGSIAGRLRAQYPENLQHFQWLEATYGVGGSLRQALTRCRREATLRSRGRSKSGIGFIMAGSAFIDRYVKFATSNGSQYTNAVTVLKDGGLSKLDIGIPDSGLHFEGIPIIHNPTFEVLDQIQGSITFPWTRRAYMIDNEAFRLAYSTAKNKFFSAPMDPADTRVIRLSIDSKVVLAPEIPNACAVLSVAA
jgi:hypothetical protein